MLNLGTEARVDGYKMLLGFIPTTHGLLRTVCTGCLAYATYIALTCPCEFYLECHFERLMLATQIPILVAWYSRMTMLFDNKGGPKVGQQIISADDAPDESSPVPAEKLAESDEQEQEQ
jgi:hypothetical protein